MVAVEPSLKVAVRRKVVPLGEEAVACAVAGEQVGRLAFGEGEGEGAVAGVGEWCVEAVGGAECPVGGGGDGVPDAAVVGAAELELGEGAVAGAGAEREGEGAVGGAVGGERAGASADPVAQLAQVGERDRWWRRWGWPRGEGCLCGGCGAVAEGGGEAEGCAAGEEAVACAVAGEQVGRLAFGEGEGEGAVAGVGEWCVEAVGGAECPVGGGGDGVPDAAVVGAAELELGEGAVAGAGAEREGEGAVGGAVGGERAGASADPVAQLAQVGERDRWWRRWGWPRGEGCLCGGCGAVAEGGGEAEGCAAGEEAVACAVAGEQVGRLAFGEGEGEGAVAGVGEWCVEAVGGAERPVGGGGDGVPDAAVVGAAELELGEGAVAGAGAEREGEGAVGGAVGGERAGASADPVAQLAQVGERDRWWRRWGWPRGEGCLCGGCGAVAEGGGEAEGCAAGEEAVACAVAGEQVGRLAFGEGEGEGAVAGVGEWCVEAVGGAERPVGGGGDGVPDAAVVGAAELSWVRVRLPAPVPSVRVKVPSGVPSGESALVLLPTRSRSLPR